MEQKFIEALVFGGTKVDDAIMDLIALSELAINDVEIMKELLQLEDEISCILSWAREQKNYAPSSSTGVGKEIECAGVVLD